ncbi:MAG: MipA/OmpV family protein [Proteobacteria bacterium]|nr:MipA/OmpV family protein [Pseudomonadota bacterium]
MGNKLVCFLAGLLMVSAGWTGECAGESAVLQEEKLPLYEYGIVGLMAHFPQYTGSDEYQTYAFPLPYFVYRGEILKADRDGIRGIFWRYKQFETDISLAGNPPAGDNDARKGMEELEALGEIGPALNYYFFDYGERDSFFLQVTLRSAFSFDFDSGLDVGHEGYVSDVSIIFRDSRIFKEQKIRFHASTGIRFADAAMHKYFYDVPLAYVTPNREYYEAEGGYGGMQLSGSITRELTPSFSASCYGRWVNIDGAVYEDSPLVGTHNNYIVGAMLVWKIGESEKREP